MYYPRIKLLAYIFIALLLMSCAGRYRHIRNKNKVKFVKSVTEYKTFYKYDIVHFGWPSFHFFNKKLKLYKTNYDQVGRTTEICAYGEYKPVVKYSKKHGDTIRTYEIYPNHVNAAIFMKYEEKKNIPRNKPLMEECWAYEDNVKKNPVLYTTNQYSNDGTLIKSVTTDTNGNILGEKTFDPQLNLMVKEGYWERPKYYTRTGFFRKELVDSSYFNSKGQLIYATYYNESTRIWKKEYQYDEHGTIRTEFVYNNQFLPDLVTLIIVTVYDAQSNKPLLETIKYLPNIQDKKKSSSRYGRRQIKNDLYMETITDFNYSDDGRLISKKERIVNTRTGRSHRTAKYEYKYKFW